VNGVVPSSTQSDQWEWSVAPYLWMFGMDGDVRIRNTSAEFDVGFDDIFDNLDIAAIASIEARRGAWGFFLEPVYGALSVDGKSGVADVEVNTELFLMDFGARYRFLDKRNEVGRARVADFSLGGRYFSIDNEIDFGVLPDRDRSTDFVDLTIGGRYAMDITDRFGMLVGGDVGGFGIGSSSEFSWNAEALLSWSFGRGGVLWGGYRMLDIDQDDGGSSGYDLELSGPLIGYEFRF
jgi:hypothetical protein